MITHLRGRLVEKNPAYVVIECNGVGYFVNISLHTYAGLPGDEACMLYTHLSVKEDSQTLYGFIGVPERNLFRHLISVSGVGPSTARMVLSSMEPKEIYTAIISGNAPVLQSVKGIGGKTAQRIIIDLQDKLTKEGLVDADKGGSDMDLSNKSYVDALSALQMLGFAKSVAEKALSKVLKMEGNDLSVERLVKESLKVL
ncbi:MAG: Holliday junction branch migration protein RuvA [Flavobacteriales bacterium]|nr:Holliday junction branch migration protein RuvA [Flavobacteriales bacterium]PCH89693.1 MAG: Holliday junction branch migration protein RuvA [Flavobacteriales bacterium]